MYIKDEYYPLAKDSEYAIAERVKNVMEVTHCEEVTAAIIVLTKVICESRGTGVKQVAKQTKKQVKKQTPKYPKYPPQCVHPDTDGCYDCEYNMVPGLRDGGCKLLHDSYKARQD